LLLRGLPQLLLLLGDQGLLGVTLGGHRHVLAQAHGDRTCDGGGQTRHQDGFIPRPGGDHADEQCRHGDDAVVGTQHTGAQRVHLRRLVGIVKLLVSARNSGLGGFPHARNLSGQAHHHWTLKGRYTVSPPGRSEGAPPFLLFSCRLIRSIFFSHTFCPYSSSAVGCVIRSRSFAKSFTKAFPYLSIEPLSFSTAFLCFFESLSRNIFPAQMGGCRANLSSYRFSCSSRYFTITNWSAGTPSADTEFQSPTSYSLLRIQNGDVTD